MTKNWIPTGYADPDPYVVNDRWIMIIGLVLILPVFMLVRPSLIEGASIFSTLIITLGDTTNLIQIPLLYVFSTVLIILSWIFISGAIIVTLHEGVHYTISAIQGLNPKFQWSSHLGLKNPSIVAYTERIRRRENMLMLLGPFAVLTPFCAAAMWFTSGFISATAAIMFSVNTVASCADLYNFVQITMMPKGTLFANFNDDGNLHSEFATPLEKESA
ncbi:DUF3267 domain-containing protein [Natrialba sp. PRR66]|uniref:DUF3267 domain-containing protein n=1 Tax=Natrialba sp. PRR66 TaxID=3098146 RepID=UPI002B1D07A2|nr:DUF3267 domain-containing protein [Natrialba sp. PRR66]